MHQNIKIKEIQCKTAIGKCGLPGGGFSINPYVGCGHNCAYCYARFIKRFTGHTEKWGTFVDVRVNIADVLKKQLMPIKFKGKQIFIGTVTDPYQPIEEKYKLTMKILQTLMGYPVSVSILTKSDLVLRDLDLLKEFKELDVNFTVNTLDENWKKIVEPNSSAIQQRLQTMKKLSEEGIVVNAMMGPYWPIFTDPETLFKEFKRVGVHEVFTESFNTTGENFNAVEKILEKHYPQQLNEIKQIFFDKKKFCIFYSDARKKVCELSKKYALPVTIYFGLGHTGKFK